MLYISICQKEDRIYWSRRFLSICQIIIIIFLIRIIDGWRILLPHTPGFEPDEEGERQALDDTTTPGDKHILILLNVLRSWFYS